MSKIAIVTGASRGIGFQTARKLSERKVQVIGVARSKKKLEKLKKSNPQYISVFSIDLTNQPAVDNLITSITEQFNSIDILINNAGALINKPFSELTLEDWHSQIESNLITAVHITKQLLDHFNNEAHIVNISSMGGFQGSAKFPGLTAYSVSKGALSILTECLAAELKKRQIKANALCLGAVQTEMLEEAFPGIEAPVSDTEMGDYIAEFALNGSKFYNGKVLPVALEDPE